LTLTPQSVQTVLFGGFGTEFSIIESSSFSIFILTLLFIKSEIFSTFICKFSSILSSSIVSVGVSTSISSSLIDVIQLVAKHSHFFSHCSLFELFSFNLRISLRSFFSSSFKVGVFY